MSISTWHDQRRVFHSLHLLVLLILAMAIPVQFTVRNDQSRFFLLAAIPRNSKDNFFVNRKKEKKIDEILNFLVEN